MGKTLTEIAQELKDNNKKVQLIYAFNGTGKTRLSREFKKLCDDIYFSTTLDKAESLEEFEEIMEGYKRKILYYNAFTEDLFYWDNHDKLMLKIHPNDFTSWILEEQGQDLSVIDVFQKYTNNKLTPHFNTDFTEVAFSYERGNEDNSGRVRISKGEESCFIWSVFYCLITQIIEVLSEKEVDNRETNDFDDLEYIFIDDPVTSLDDNHLIELAVDLAQQIKKNESNLKFIITTHNALFFNVLFNELKKNEYKKYTLKKELNGEYELSPQGSDSPFAYHLFLKKELEDAVNNDAVEKYHLNLLRNILEKTSTFLGYKNWGELLENDPSNRPMKHFTRLINLSSHSKHADYEAKDAIPTIKEVIDDVLKLLNETYKFK